MRASATNSRWWNFTNCWANLHYLWLARPSQQQTCTLLSFDGVWFRVVRRRQLWLPVVFEEHFVTLFMSVFLSAYSFIFCFPMWSRSMTERGTNPNSGTAPVCAGEDGNFVQILLPNRQTARVLPVVLWAVEVEKMSSSFLQSFPSSWAARMVFSIMRLNRSTSELAWGQYGVTRRCFILCMLRYDSNPSDVNCGQLSGTIFSGRPCVAKHDFIFLLMAPVVVFLTMETSGQREHESIIMRRDSPVGKGPHKSACKTLHAVAGIGDMWSGSGLGGGSRAWHEM